MGLLVAIALAVAVAAVYVVVRSRRGRPAAVANSDKSGAARPSSVQRGSVRLQLETKTMFVDGHEYMADFVASPSGRHALAWSTSTAMDGRVITSANAPGIHVLTDAGMVILSGRVTEIEHAAVADDGSFVLACPNPGGGLGCTVHAFRRDGAQVIMRRLPALPHKVAISSDGRFALCQLYHCDDDNNSGRAVLFDMESGDVMWKREPPAGWAEHYQIDSERGEVVLRYDNGLLHRYSLDGRFLDAESWRVERINYLYGDQLLDEIGKRRGRLAQTDTADREVLIRALQQGVQRTHSDHMKAKLLRQVGELRLECGDKTGAIEAFSAAVVKDPKVGVKKLLDGLRGGG